MSEKRARPLLMGILNITPDSFFQSHFALEDAIAHAKSIVNAKADILDVGGESTRPGSIEITEEEEISRVIELIEILAKELPIPISIDTRKPKVAQLAISKGAKFINDITGFSHPAMQELAAGCNADLCLMHMQNTPQTMQLNPSYPQGVVSHLMQFFEERIKQLTQRGVKQERIILDPGIGFGKSLEHNYLLLQAIDKFKAAFGLRLLIGASRKSFIQKTVHKPTEQLLAATLAAHSFCLIKGADIIRVHDVKEHRDIIDLLYPLILHHNKKDCGDCEFLI